MNFNYEQTPFILLLCVALCYVCIGSLSSVITASSPMLLVHAVCSYAISATILGYLSLTFPIILRRPLSSFTIVRNLIDVVTYSVVFGIFLSLMYGISLWMRANCLKRNGRYCWISRTGQVLWISSKNFSKYRNRSDDFSKAMSTYHNRLMHALNGNIRGRHPNVPRAVYQRYMEVYKMYLELCSLQPYPSYYFNPSVAQFVEMVCDTDDVFFSYIDTNLLLPVLHFFLQMDGYAALKQRVRNKFAHALNGNIKFVIYDDPVIDKLQCNILSMQLSVVELSAGSTPAAVNRSNLKQIDLITHMFTRPWMVDHEFRLQLLLIAKIRIQRLAQHANDETVQQRHNALMHAYNGNIRAEPRRTIHRAPLALQPTVIMLRRRLATLRRQINSPNPIIARAARAEISRLHNRLMHALNGNIRHKGPRSRGPITSNNSQFLSDFMDTLRRELQPTREHFRVLQRAVFSDDEIRQACRDDSEIAQLRGNIKLIRATVRPKKQPRRFTPLDGKYAALAVDGDLDVARRIFDEQCSPAVYGMSMKRYKRMLAHLDHRLLYIEVEGWSDMSQAITNAFNEFAAMMRSMRFVTSPKFNLASVLSNVASVLTDCLAIYQIVSLGGNPAGFLLGRLLSTCLASFSMSSIFSVIKWVRTLYPHADSQDDPIFPDENVSHFTPLDRAIASWSLEARRAIVFSPSTGRKYTAWFEPRTGCINSLQVGACLLHLPQDCPHDIVICADVIQYTAREVNTGNEYLVCSHPGEQFRYPVENVTGLRCFSTEALGLCSLAPRVLSEGGEHPLVSLVGLVTHVIFGVGNAHMNEDRARRVSKLAGGINSVASLVKNITPLLSLFTEHAYESIWGEPYLNAVTPEMRDRTYTLMFKMRALLSRVEEPMTPSLAELVVALNGDVQQHLTLLATTMPNKVSYAPFSSVAIAFSRMVEAVRLFSVSTEPRIETTGVAFYGPPGVGKTELVDSLHAYTMALMREKNYHNRLCTRPDGQYMNGYLPGVHTGLLYDDIFQGKDAELNLLHTLELIQMVGSAPYFVNMADVDRKGVTQFTSQLLYVTTNDPLVGIGPGCVIRSPEALARRLLCFEVSTIDPDYSKELKRYVVKKPFNPSVLRFQPYVLRITKDGKPTRRYIGNLLTFHDVALILAGAVLKKTAVYLKNRDHVVDLSTPEARSAFQQGVRPADAGFDEIDQPLVASYDAHMASCYARTEGWFDWFYRIRPPEYDWSRFRYEFAGDLAPYESFFKNLCKDPKHLFASGDHIYPYTVSSFDAAKVAEACRLQDGGTKWSGLLNFRQLDFLIAHEVAKTDSYMDAHVAKVLDQPRSNMIIFLGALAVLLGTAASIYYVYSKQEVAAEVGYEKGLIRLPLRKPEIKAQVGDDNSLAVANKLRTQFAKVQFFLNNQDGRTGGVLSGIALCIRGQQFICPKHYIADYPHDQIQARLFFHNQVYEFRPHEIHFKVWDDADLMTVKFDRIPFGYDLTHLFIHSDNLDARLQGKVYRVAPMDIQNSSDLYFEVSENGKIDLEHTLTTFGPVRDSDQPYYTKRFISLRMSNGDGKCGGMLFLDNPNAAQKIIGMHIAGADGTSYFVLITDKLLDKYLFGEIRAQCEVLDHVTIEPITLTQDPSIYDKFVPKHAVKLGLLPPEFSNHIARETKIVRTKFLPDFDPPCLPAMLHPVTIAEERVDPLMKAQIKASVPEQRCNEFFLNIATTLIERDCVRVGSNIKGVLTFDEAVSKPLDYTRLNQVKLSTSPGFSFKTHSKTPGKHGYLEVNDEGFIVDEQGVLRGAVGCLLDKLRQSVLVPFVYFIALKDELRDRARVLAAKTRTVKGSSLASMLVEKILYGCVVEWTCRFPHVLKQTFMSNPCGQLWAMLFKCSLNRITLVFDIANNDNEFQNDLRRYETRVRDFIANLCDSNGMAGWTADELSAARRALNDILMQPCEVIGNVLYQKSLGLSSGSFLTTWSNGVGNRIFVIAVFLLLLVQHCPQDFEALVKGQIPLDDMMVSYHNGDDVISFVDPRYTFWTFENVQKFSAVFGRTIQRPDKGLYNKDFDGSIETAEYLSRSFEERSGCIFAPLRAEKIISIPLWRWKSSIPDNIMQPELCEDALVQWCEHGMEKFNYYKAQYDAELRRLGYRVTSLTYASVLSQRQHAGF